MLEEGLTNTKQLELELTSDETACTTTTTRPTNQFAAIQLQLCEGAQQATALRGEFSF